MSEITRALFDSFAEGLLAESGTRPLFIVGASKVDHLLSEVLRTFLLPKSAKATDQDELLEGDMPLSTFSARIKICRRLGLIDDTLYRALERLRAIRNLCAHSLSFDDTKFPVRDHLAEFKRLIVGRASYRLTWERFSDCTSLQTLEEWQCLLLTLCVLLEAIRESVETTPGNKFTLNIAAR